jgi:(heptosyl)LPS beta-1,4-glucosyltransferase
MLNVNKNYGFSKAKNDWILSLDADERVTDELVAELQELFDNSSMKNGYWIPRRNIIFGKWIKHTGWYPDHVLRLFKKDKGTFEEKHVHEMIKLDGEAGYLKSDLIHLNYESIAQFLHKTIVIYAPNEAAELQRKGYKFNFSDAFRFPLNEFLSRYFSREGYKDGFHGLVLSMLMAMYHFIVFAILWEAKGFKEIDHVGMLEKTEQEVARGYKDFMYWVYTEKIKATRSSAKKVVFKVLRKI